MKTSKTTKAKRNKKQQAPKLPTYSRKPLEFLSSLEIAVLHYYAQTEDHVKTYKAFNLPFDEFKRIIDRASIKLKYFSARFENIHEEIKNVLNPPKGNSRHIEVLGFSTRIKHCLIGAEILTVGDLIKLKEHDLMRIRGISAGSIGEIKKVLRKNKINSPLLK